MQHLTSYSHLCILKLANMLLKVSQRLFKGHLSFCAAEERNAGERHLSDLHWAKMYFLVLQVGFFWWREQHTKEFITTHTGCSAMHSSSKKTHMKDAKGKCLHLMGFSGRPGMKTQVSPPGAPSRCFPPPRAVEGDVGMPFGSRFDSAGFCRLINSVWNQTTV